MASDRLIMCRPIVIDTSSDNVTVSGTAITLTAGTYAHIGHLGKHIQSKVIAAAGPPDDFAVSFSTGKVAFAAGSAYTVTWTDTGLRDLLGFAGNLSSASTHTADYTPESVWFPTRARADNGEWEIDHRAQWKGVEARSGNVAGLRTGVTRYSTTIDFDALPVAEVLYSRGTTTVAQNRSLDHFATESREVWGTTGEPSPAGFYLFPDYTNLAIGTASTWDSGDASKLCLVSSPDTFVFCHFDADWYPRPKASINVRSDYFGVSIDVHSAEAPDWTGGD
jgi:hypothetical protein